VSSSPCSRRICQHTTLLRPPLLHETNTNIHIARPRSLDMKKFYVVARGRVPDVYHSWYRSRRRLDRAIVASSGALLTVLTGLKLRNSVINFRVRHTEAFLTAKRQSVIFLGMGRCQTARQIGTGKDEKDKVCWWITRGTVRGSFLSLGQHRLRQHSDVRESHNRNQQEIADPVIYPGCRNHHCLMINSTKVS